LISDERHDLLALGMSACQQQADPHGKRGLPFKPAEARDGFYGEVMRQSLSLAWQEIWEPFNPLCVVPTDVLRQTRMVECYCVQQTERFAKTKLQRKDSSFCSG